jgi:phosphatidylserine/phosphatidylglycerophosphate/cardiolipin synthase-like enzyme
VRDLPDVRAQLEALQTFGISLDNVRVLPNTHTKGIVVDSAVVSVGSHNWSSDGVLYNRDASMIVYDADVAKYYEDIFLYDWTRARQRLEFESAMPIVASESETTPVGYRAVPWTAIYDGGR